MNKPTPLLTGYERQLADLENKSLLRQLRAATHRDGKTIFMNGRSFLNLSSNDYLGLATRTALLQAFYEKKTDDNLVDRFGPGSSSSRLLTGNFNLYPEMESLLCDLYGCEAALVFNSGYHANIGMIPALAGEKDLIVSDRLNHASIVDGIRLSKAACLIFEHNNMADLERLLQASRSQYENVWIIVESVFSMDGDLADLAALVEIKNRHNAMLYVDEAHSVGIYGSTGLGLSHDLGLCSQVDVLLCPMGKALASHGSYAVTWRVIKQVLVNRMRSLLYTTALPPVAMNWNCFVMGHLESFSKQRQQLADVSRFLRQGLDALDIAYTGETHIIPVLAGDSDAAVELAERLQADGFLVFPIRWPTVPENQARIRISLTADITCEDLAPLPAMIHKFICEKAMEK